MEIRNEAQRMAIKAALIRITADNSWTVMRDLADEVIYNLEQKSLQEDDEEKAKTYRHDARGARKFWAQWLGAIEQAKGADSSEDFLEVVM
jgi:hypothetical protein